MKGFTVNAGGHEFSAPEAAWLLGEDFLKRYLSFPRPLTSYNYYELKNLAFLGGMGVGKSTQIRRIMKSIADSFPGLVNYFMADSIDMAVTHSDLRPMQLICIDDAASSNDSRLSMGLKRATQTQGFFVLRHQEKAHNEQLKEQYLTEIQLEIDDVKKDITNKFQERLSELQSKEEKLKKRKIGGIILIIWSFQHYGSIEVRYKEFFDAIFVKGYSRDPTVKKLLNNNKEMLNLLKDITRENYYNNYEARNLAVGCTKAEDLIVLKTDKIQDEEFPVPFYSGESLRQIYSNKVFAKLLLEPLELLSDSKDVIYGYFRNKYKDDPEFDKYHIGKFELGDMIEEMKFLKRREIDFFKEHGVEPDHIKFDEVVKPLRLLTLDEVLQNKTISFDLMSRMRAEDIAWRKIGSIFRENHGNLYTAFRAIEKQKAQQIKDPNIVQTNPFDLIHVNERNWGVVFDLMRLMKLTLDDIAAKTQLPRDFIEHRYQLWQSTQIMT